VECCRHIVYTEFTEVVQLLHNRRNAYKAAMELQLLEVLRIVICSSRASLALCSPGNARSAIMSQAVSCPLIRQRVPRPSTPTTSRPTSRPSRAWTAALDSRVSCSGAGLELTPVPSWQQPTSTKLLQLVGTLLTISARACWVRDIIQELQTLMKLSQFLRGYQWVCVS